MNMEPHEPLLAGITYEDSVPIEWEVLPVLPSVGEQHRLNRGNEQLLQNMLYSDEMLIDAEEGEETPGLEHIKRLELKMDLLMSVLTEMISANGSLPFEHALTLASNGLRVRMRQDEVADIPKHGGLLRIRLYLDTRLPRPLEFFGDVLAVEGDSFTVQYHALEPRTQDLLDKLVFRYHRRAIASSRQSGES